MPCGISHSTNRYFSGGGYSQIAKAPATHPCLPVVSLTLRVVLLFASGVIALLVTPAPLLSQIQWTKSHANPVLGLGAPGSWDSAQVFFPSVLLRDSIYMMWYAGDDGTLKFRVGRATSKDGVTWTRDSLNPGLNIGPKGSWDDFEAWLPQVLYDGNRYRMWYAGASGGFLLNIRLGDATSTDGRTWQKDTLNPLDATIPGPPCLHIEGSAYKGWYGLANGVGYATSTDGIHWTSSPQNPVLTPGPAGSWDEAPQGMGACVLWDSAFYHMWYAPLTNYLDLLTPGIGYAVSTDGVHWKKYPGNPVLADGVAGAWDNSVFAPTVVRKGDTFEMWYAGGAPWAAGIGYASSPRAPATMTLVTSTTMRTSVTTGVGASAIDFNNIHPGAESDTAHITISNWGFTPLTVPTINRKRPEFVFCDAPALPLTIPPFSDYQLNLIFSPTQAGVVLRDTIVFLSNGSSLSQNQVTLRGRGSGAIMPVSGGTIYGLSGSPAGSQLSTINKSTGKADSIAVYTPDPLPVVSGFAIRSADNLMYVASSSGEVTRLCRISTTGGDIESAVTIPLGRITAMTFTDRDILFLADTLGRVYRSKGISGDTAFVGVSGRLFTSIAQDPVTHALWGSTKDTLFTIDTATGRATLVGATHADTACLSIAFDGFGELHALFSNGLIALLDVITVGVSPIGFTGASGLRAIAMRNDITGAAAHGGSSLPREWGLRQNYPNPFNPATVIRFDVPERSHVRLTVYDLLGREVATLVDEVKSGGSYAIPFNGLGLASGIYLYRMQAQTVQASSPAAQHSLPAFFADTKKMLILK